MPRSRGMAWVLAGRCSYFSCVLRCCYHRFWQSSDLARHACASHSRTRARPTWQKWKSPLQSFLKSDFVFVFSRRFIYLLVNFPSMWEAKMEPHIDHCSNKSAQNLKTNSRNCNTANTEKRRWIAQAPSKRNSSSSNISRICSNMFSNKCLARPQNTMHVH